MWLPSRIVVGFFVVLLGSGFVLPQHPAALEDKLFKDISKPPKRAGDEMEQRFKDVKKALEPSGKAPPDEMEKVVKDIQKAYDKAAKLPADLPGWFDQLDTDRDGQVGLYERKLSGWSLAMFSELDLNDDGFLTIDEVRRSLGRLQELGLQTAAATPDRVVGTGGKGKGKDAPDKLDKKDKGAKLPKP